MTVALLLDEMFSPEIAEQLRQRGHDVVAVLEDPTLISADDDDVLLWASKSARCVVTENQRDFIPKHEKWLSQKRPHGGILITSSRRHKRNLDAMGRLIQALDDAIRTERIPGPDELLWL